MTYEAKPPEPIGYTLPRDRCATGVAPTSVSTWQWSPRQGIAAVEATSASSQSQRNTAPHSLPTSPPNVSSDVVDQVISLDLKKSRAEIVPISDVQACLRPWHLNFYRLCHRQSFLCAIREQAYLPAVP